MRAQSRSKPIVRSTRIICGFDVLGVQVEGLAGARLEEVAELAHRAKGTPDVSR